MKTLIRFSICAVFLGVLVSSCSVQKRQYRPGYEVTWNHHQKQITRGHAAIDTAAMAAETPASNIPAAEATTKDIAVTSAEHITQPQEPAARQKETLTLPPVNSGHTGLSASAEQKPSMVRSVVKQIGQLAVTGEGRVNGFAVAGMVLGIVALAAYYGAFVLGVLAIIFSAIALKQIRANGGRGRLMALAGLICGIVALAIIITIVMVAVAT